MHASVYCSVVLVRVQKLIIQINDQHLNRADSSLPFMQASADNPTLDTGASKLKLSSDMLPCYCRCYRS